MSAEDATLGQLGDLAIPEYAAEFADPDEEMASPLAVHQHTRALSLINSPLRLLLVAQTLGWTVDLLFYGKALGISVPIFVLLILGALFALGWKEGVRPEARNLWLLVPLLFFAFMVFVRANATLTMINVSMTAALLALFIYLYSGGSVHRLGVFAYLVVPFDAAIASATQPPSVIRSAARNAHLVRERNFSWLIAVLRGIFVAIPVLVVFIWLLSSADIVFSHLVGDTLQINAFPNVGEWSLRVAIILVSAWFLSGAFTYALSRGRLGYGEPYEIQPGGRTSLGRIGLVETATVLVLVDLLFGVFAWIQFTYVFFGPATSLYYEDYREYVRQGFGQLLVAAVLTMVLIVGLRRLARLNTPAHARLFNVLSTVMVILTGVMLLSAFRRMLAWEDVQFYISTPVRIYVRAFIVWLAALFAWLLFALWVQIDRFAIGLFAAALGFVATINMMNPDAVVAAYNLQRNDGLSTRYLGVLSEDAVPTLVAGLDTISDPMVRDSLRAHLSERLYDMEHDPNRSNWQSYQLARSQAYDLLVQNKNLLDMRAP